MSSLVGLLTLNFLAPLILGGAEFGLATALLSVPFLFQAIADPIINSLTIRSLRTPSARASLAQLCRDSFCWAGGGALLAAFLCYYHLAARQNAAALPFAICAGGLLVISIATTQLFAIAYALQQFSRIACAYLAAAVGLVLGLAAFGQWSALGFVGTLWASQLGAQLVLVTSPRVRRFAIRTHLEALRGRSSRTIRASYLPALAPRLVTVALTSGLLVAASLRYSHIELAEFKLTISIILAFNAAIPLSPEVLQALAARSQGAALAGKSRFVMLMFALAAAMALACYAGATAIYRFLLGSEGSGDAALLFLGMPLFLLVSPVASYMFVSHQERRILIASTAATAVTAASALCWDARIAFLAGAATFLALSGIFDGARIRPAGLRQSSWRRKSPPAIDEQPASLAGK